MVHCSFSTLLPIVLAACVSGAYIPRGAPGWQPQVAAAKPIATLSAQLASSHPAQSAASSAATSATVTNTGAAPAATADAGVAAPPSDAAQAGIASARTGLADSSTRGLLVQFTGPPGSNATLVDALQGAVPLIEQETGTLSWFGASVTSGNSTGGFVIYDTFLDEAGRTAHLAGQVAGSVVGQADTFVNGLSIDPFDIFAIKADNERGANVTVGLRILFNVQADQITNTQQFCRTSLALIAAEAGTLNWICFQIPDSQTFGILDSFTDEAARDVHLSGAFAKALFAFEGLDGQPDVQQTDIVAASAKSGPPPVVAPSDAAADTGVDGPLPLTSTATLGLLVPITARSAQSAAVRDFLANATALAAQEPGTLQWFAAQIQNSTDADFLVFDTFAAEADRQAHLGGKVAAGLLSQIGALSAVDITPYDILAIKSTNNVTGDTAGVTVGLQALFTAAEDKITQVQEFCKSSLALAQAEVGTLNWICFQVPNTTSFGILDSFADDAARTAHLNGKVVAGLLGIVDTLLSGQPEIKQLEIVGGTAQPDVASS